MSYSVEWAKPALKELRKLDNQTQQRIWLSIDNLLINKANIKKLTDRVNEWKLRVGDYRVILVMDRVSKKIFITHIKHRKDVYR